jgi:hypothetical protein
MTLIQVRIVGGGAAFLGVALALLVLVEKAAH